MNLERRLEKLEAVLTEQRQETPDPVDLSRLTEDEFRTLEDLAATACGPNGVWALDKLTDGELRTLRAMADKTRDEA